MSAILLQPGFGSAYTTEDFVDTSTIGADTIDTSRCSQFAIQVEKTVSTTPVGTVQLQQSFDGAKWANLGTPISVANADDGSIVRYSAAHGPYGLIRFDATAITTSGAHLRVVGFPMQQTF